MDLANWNIWELVTFKTNSYYKNFDFLIENENIITEYDGNISLIRIKEKKFPLPIGEYSFSIWNLELGKKIKANINKLIKTYGKDNVYVEIVDMIKKKTLKTKNYSKVIFIHSLILHPDYRKKEITEEFIEFLYRNYYDDDIGIIAFVLPVQNNMIDSEFYRDDKKIKLRENIQSDNHKIVTAYDYYQINKFLKKTDAEKNEYKLFSIASRCGFSRINESHLFLYSPEKTMERINEKQKIINKEKKDHLKN